MVETKLKVFNEDNDMYFDMDVPAFLKEIAENTKTPMYPSCWVVLKSLLAQVAQRAIELNDPILHVLMLRMRLYEVDVKERVRLIEELKEIVENER